MQIDNLFDTLLSVAKATPKKPAFVAEDKIVTYQQLCSLIETTTTALNRLGLTQGERILFWDHNKIGYLATLLACYRTGLTLVPANAQSPDAWKQQTIKRLGIAATVRGLEALNEGKIETYNNRQHSSKGDVLTILTTSGTTGIPKDVPIHAGMIKAAANNTIESFRLDETSVFLDCLPAHTVGGLFLAGLPQLMAGSTSVSWPFSPYTFAAIVETHRPTHAILLPVMVSMLRNTTSWPTLDLSNFHVVGSGASTVTESVADALLTRGVQQVLHLFGMTECLTPVMDHCSMSSSKAPKTIFSRLCGDYEAQLADDGELMLKGTAVIRGYLGDPALNANAFEDGWFKTGDLFTFESGIWCFAGRKKEIIKLGGFSVSPVLTEKLILDLPGVRNCAVAKDISRSGGERLVAVIEGENMDQKTLLNVCRQQLAPHQVPRRVLVVDTIPLNAMRKVDRAAVDRMLEQE